MLQRNILTGATANGVGSAQQVADYRTVMVAVTITTAFTTGTLKFQGSINDPNADPAVGGGLPLFGSAQSKNNQWAFIQSVKLADGTAVDGATGIDLSAGGGTTFFLEMNVNAITWLNCQLSSITGAGEVTVTVSGYGENI